MYRICCLVIMVLVAAGTNAQSAVTGLSTCTTSLGGAHLITIHGRGFSLDQFNLFDESKGNLVNWYSDTGEYACDILKDGCTATTITCYTRPMPEDEYQLKVTVDGTKINGDDISACSLAVKQYSTPTIDSVTASTEPGGFLNLTGKIFTDRYGSNIASASNGNSKKILRVYAGGSECSLKDPATQELYDLRLDQKEDGTYTDYGFLRCKMQGSYVGNINVSIIVEDLGRTVPDLVTKGLTTEAVIYMVQTYAVITSITPAVGSVSGGTNITVSGRNFDETDAAARIFVAGEPCLSPTYHSSTKMTCKTPAKLAVTKDKYPGGRGVNVEKWLTTQKTIGDIEDILLLTDAAGDYETTRQESMDYEDETTNTEYVVKLSAHVLIPVTGTYRLYVRGSGGAQVYVNTTGGTTLGSFAARCLYTCNNYNKVSGDYQLTKGQLIYVVVVHRHEDNQSFSGVMLQTDKATMLGDQTGVVKQEQQNVHISSDESKEVQKITIEGFGSVSSTSTVKTLDLTNIDATNDFKIIIFGVASEWMTSTGSASDIEMSLKKLPIIGETISVTYVTTSNVVNAKFDISFNTDMGNILSASITTQKRPNSSPLSVSVSDKIDGVAGLNHLTLQLMADVLVPTIDHAALAQEMKEALKIAIGAICPKDFYDQDAAKFTEDFESEQGLTCGGDQDRTVEAFCGRSSVKKPDCIFTRSNKMAFSVDLKMCYAYKGNMSEYYRVVCLESDESGGANRTVWRDTDLATSESWNYTCVTLKHLVPSTCVKVVSVRFAGDGHQDDHWIDAVTVTEDTSFYQDGPEDMKSQIRTQPKPGGQIITDVDVVKDADYHITLSPHDCGHDIPLIQPYGAVQQAAGYPVGSGGLVVVERTAPAHLPVTGSVTLGFQGKSITVPAISTGEEVQKAFENQDEYVKVIQTGNCSDFMWDITWTKRMGDQPEMTLENNALNGNNVVVTLTTEANGATNFPVRGDMTRTVHQDTQVMAYINNIPTACDDGQDCSFIYSNAATPVITAFSPSQGSQEQGTVIKVTGTGFSATPSVWIGDVLCDVTAASVTQITCSVGHGPSGPATVAVYIDGIGDATLTTSDQFTFLAGVGSISPEQGSLGGGTDLTLTGWGFAADATVTVGGESCEVIGVTQPGQIVCITPSSDTAVAAPVVVTNYGQSLTSATTFTYDSALTPQLTSADSSTSSVIGGGTIILGGVGFGSSATVLIGNKPAEVTESTDTQVTAVYPPQAAGYYKIKVKSGTNGYAAVGSDVSDVHYILALDAISPAEGSLYGGTAVTGVGQGFGTNVSMLDISVGNTPCDVFSLTDTQFVCRIQSTANTVLVDNEGYSSTYGEGFAWRPATVAPEVGDVVIASWKLPGDNKVKFRETVGPNGDAMAGGWDSGYATNAGSFRIQIPDTGSFWYKSNDDPQAKTFHGKITAEPKPQSVVPVTLRVGNFEATYNTQSGVAVPAAAGGCGRTTSPITGCGTVAPSGGSPDKFNYAFAECQSGEVTAMTCDKDMVTLTGSGWSSTNCQNAIIVGDHACVVTSLNTTTVVCQIDTSSPTEMETDVKHAVHAFVSGRGASIMRLRDPTCVLRPFVSDVSPLSGSYLGGAFMTISGIGLMDTVVTIDGYPCVVIDQSYTGITCIVPPGVVGEPRSVQVKTKTHGSLVSCPQPCTFTYNEEPLVTSITPSYLDGSEMKTITIAGSGFGTDAAAVVATIGSEDCANPTIPSDDVLIECEMQYLPLGTHPVNVTVSPKGKAIGTVTVEGTGILTSVSPTAGSERGNTSITLQGNGFIRDATTVTVGSNPCVISATTLSTVTCWTPSGSGTQQIAVLVSSTSYSQQVHYAFDPSRTPTVTAVNPSTATSNTQITVTGTRFSTNNGENVVTIGGAACSVTSQSDTEVICTTGIHSAGTFPVSVIRTGGYGKADGDINFTYGLTTSALNPSSGGLAGGQKVSINGQGFEEDSTSATICDQTATVAWAESTPSMLVVETPQSSGTTTVSCDVVVTSGAETSTLTSGYMYDASLTPEITAVTPKHGGTGGGTLVTIAGTGFGTNQGDVAVSIGGVPCVVQSVTGTEVTCITGPRQGSISTVVDLRKQDGGMAKQTSAGYDYLDIWSSPSSWGGNTPPEEGDFVVIPKGQKILLDVTTPILKMLLIQGGHVIVDEQDLELNAEYILITDNGSFQAGTEAEPFQHKFYMTLHGHVRSTELPIYGAKVLAVRSGHLGLHGKPVENTWTRLAETAEEGDSSLSLEDSSPDWEVGSEVVIATTGHRHSQAETEVRTITAVSGDGLTLTLDRPLLYKHLGVSETYGDTTVDFRAEVGLLTRNIVVRGQRDDQFNDVIEACPEGFDTGEFATQTCFQGRFGEEMGNDQFGAQIMFHSKNASGKIEYVEVTYAGQAFRLGRYPIHFHLMADKSDCYVRGVAIHETFNRAVNIHGTHNVLIEKNVVYNVMGGALFLEDGVEMGNRFQYNLALFVKASSSLLNDDITPACFWVTNANNTYLWNNAAGGTHFGFWFRPLPHAEGPSSDSDISPQSVPLGLFSGNEVHSMGWFGVWVFERYVPRENGDPDGPSQPAVFNNTVVWSCEKGMEFVLMGAFDVRDSVFVGNEKAGFEVKLLIGPEGSTHRLINTVMVAYSPLLEEQPEWSKRAIGSGAVLNYGSGMEFQSTAFHLYDKDPFVAMSFTKIQGTCINLCGGFNYKFSETSFVNSPRRLEFGWKNEGALIDVDGTMTGEPAGRTVVPQSDVNPDSCYDALAGFNVGAVPASFCPNTEAFGHIAFNNVHPDSLFTKLALFENEFGVGEAPYEFHRVTHPQGHVALLPLGQTYRLSFQDASQLTNISYDATFYSFEGNSFIIVCQRLESKPDRFFYYAGMDEDDVWPMSPGPLDGAVNLDGDWHYDDTEKLFCYVVSGTKNSSRPGTTSGPDIETSINAYKCEYEGCIAPDPNSFPPQCTSTDGQTWSTFDWAAVPQEQCLTWNGDTATCSPPGNGDDLLIPAGTWMTLDTSPPELNTLFIEGTLEVQQGAVGIQITATYIYIFKGQFIIGCDKSNPFTGSAVISLRGNHSTPAFQYPSGHNGPNLGSKSMGVFGALMLNGQSPGKTWTNLAATANTGTNTLTLAEPVSWKAGDTVVVAATRFRPEEAEVAEISEAETILDNLGQPDYTVLTLSGPLKFDHQFSTETLETGESYTMAAEVGLLTRNIRVEGEFYDNMHAEAFGGRILVSAVQNGDDAVVGYGRFSNTQFKNMGQEGFTSRYDPRQAVVFKDTGDATDADKPSYVSGCSFDHSYSSSVVVIGADNLPINDNVFCWSIGPAIVTMATGTQITDNMILGFSFPGSINDRYEAANSNIDALVNARYATSLALSGNAFSSSERACLVTLPEPQTPVNSVPVWSNNVCHSSLFGIVQFAGTIEAWPSGEFQFSNFTIYKIYLYGLYYFSEKSIKISNMKFIDNGISIFPFLLGPSVVDHQVDPDQYLTVENSLFVGHSVDYDCDKDTIDSDAKYYKISVEGTAPGVKNNGVHGLIGMALVSCTSGANNAPLKPLNNIMMYQSIACQSTVKGCTFANFNSDKCPGNYPVAISTPPSNDDFIHPTFFSSTRFSNVATDNKVYMKEPTLGKVNPSDCVDMDCDGYKKVLIKDTDGSFTGRNVDTDVMSISEFEYNGDSRRGVGDARIPKTALVTPDGIRIPYTTIAQKQGILRDDSCVKNDISRTWTCSGFDHHLVMVESMDADTETRRLSPVALVSRDEHNRSFVDLINGPQDHGWCSGYTCRKRVSLLPFILTAGRRHELYFTGTSPKLLRFHMPSSGPDKKVEIGVYYTFPNALDLYVDGNLIPPKNSKQENGQTVLLHPSESAPGTYFPNVVTDDVGTHFYDRDWKQFHLIMAGGHTVDIKTRDAIQIGLTIITIDEFFGPEIVSNLATFLQVPSSKIRILDVQTNGGTRRKRSTGSTTYYVEIADGSCSNINCTGEPVTMTYTDLVTIASDILNAFQNGVLSSLLNVTINDMSVSEVVPPTTDPSWQTFVAASTSERIVQVLNTFSFYNTITVGAEGNAFTQQPKLRFTDPAGVHVSSLGVAAIPWKAQAILRSSTGSNILTTLTGNTTVDFVDGWANFSDLALSHSGSGFIIDFDIIFPESNFTLESEPLVVPLRPFKIDVAYTAGNAYTSNAHELRFKVVDTTTNTNVDNLVWNGGVWSATVTASTTSGYVGALSGTTSANVDPVTSEVTFNNLLFDTAGIQILTVRVTSTTGYNLTMEKEVIVLSSALQSMVPDISRILAVTYDIDFNVYGHLDFAAAAFMNTMMTQHPLIAFSELSVSQGSVVITVSVTGNTTTVSSVMSGVCSDISTGSTFTYNGATFTLSSTMTVDGEQYYGVSCEKKETDDSDDTKIALIVGLVIGILAVLVLIGVFLFWKLKIVPKTKTHKITTKEDETRYVGTMSPSEDILWREQSFMSIREKSLPDHPMPGISTHIGGRSTPMY